VPIDSVYKQLTQRQVQSASEIEATARTLQTRYAAGAATLGIPAPFPEEPLDVLAGYSLEAKQPDLAVKLLRENLDHYPQSSNAHESMGEGLVAVGDTSGAVEQFHTAIAIAKVEIQKPTSVLARAHERDVMSAAVAQLHALHREQLHALHRE
jgi:hypothetical protein